MVDSVEDVFHPTDLLFAKDLHSRGTPPNKAENHGKRKILFISLLKTSCFEAQADWNSQQF